MWPSESNVIKTLYEDNHLLAINKPSGWLSQGDKTGDVPILDLAKMYIKEQYHKPGNVFLGLCHRLDRPVSGVLLLARTSKALKRINQMFSEGIVKKTYLAVSSNMPRQQSGTIAHWLVKNTNRNIVTSSSTKAKDGKQAITYFRVLDTMEGYTLIEVRPQSGRSHQIRVALSSINAPIIGDVKYGGISENPKSIALHCQSLELVHPVTKEMINISAPVPDELPWLYF